nr:fatty acid--CoA ligase family protein [uncultured Actinoplanes sp.]
MTGELTAARVTGLLDRTGERSRLPEMVDGFRRLALGEGAVVLIALPNGVALLDALFAALLTGHVPALLSPSAPGERVAATAVALGAAAVVRRRVAGEEAYREVVPAAGVTLAAYRGRPPVRHRPGRMILMTSGTSGAGTGCLHDVPALLRNAARHAAAIGQTGRDTVLVSLPMYYSYALVAQVFGSLLTGSRLVIGAPPFTAPHYRETIDRHRVTVSALTPLLVRALVAGSPHLPQSLRCLGIGGDALDPVLIRRLVEANPGAEIYLTYGLTEAGPRVSTLAAHDEPAHRYTSAGRPLDGVTLSLRPVPGGAGSELLVASDTVCLDVVGTGAEARRGRLLAPGTVATGDLAEIDAAGYLTVRGRISDFVLVRGEKVSLATVRRAAESLPSVVRAVVAADAVDGLRLDLYLADRHTLSPHDIHRSLGRTLLPAERPGRLVLHPAGQMSAHK